MQRTPSERVLVKKSVADSGRANRGCGSLKGVENKRR